MRINTNLYLSIAVTAALCSCASDSKDIPKKSENHEPSKINGELPKTEIPKDMQDKSVDVATPAYLYKVVSVKDWKVSQEEPNMALSSQDDKFIHLATDVQLEGIVDKFWKDEESFIIIKLDSTKLPGKLILESNPGGTTKYYHLYDGSIPMTAVIEAKLFTHKPKTPTEE